MSQKLTGAAVAEHNSKDSCWVIVHGKAYDVTEFLPGWYARFRVLRNA
jgi:L-lactate dehydrogenase (cytochrome)